MTVPWLNPEYPSLFPSAASALKDPNGLLAVGGDLSIERLLAAYSQGIFPWYDAFLEDGKPSPILWWCPQPRCVLRITDLKISRSLSQSIRNRGYQVSFNQNFAKTIRNCASRGKPSQTQQLFQENEHSPEHVKSPELIKENESLITSKTWINPDMISAYEQLHRLGHAHSVECWLDDQLVGGLYGVCIGSMFYGESMFSKARDASKVALFYLTQILSEQGASCIDCQISNPHLSSLGAKDIKLDTFMNIVQQHIQQPDIEFPTDMRQSGM